MIVTGFLHTDAHGFTFYVKGFTWEIIRSWRRARILGSVFKMQLLLLSVILCFSKGLIAPGAAESIGNPFLLEELELHLQLVAEFQPAD